MSRLINGILCTSTRSERCSANFLSLIDQLHNSVVSKIKNTQFHSYDHSHAIQESSSDISLRPAQHIERISILLRVLCSNSCCHDETPIGMRTFLTFSVQRSFLFHFIFPTNNGARRILFDTFIKYSVNRFNTTRFTLYKLIIFHLRECCTHTLLSFRQILFFSPHNVSMPMISIIRFQLTTIERSKKICSPIFNYDRYNVSQR